MHWVGHRLRFGYPAIRYLRMPWRGVVIDDILQKRVVILLSVAIDCLVLEFAWVLIVVWMRLMFPMCWIALDSVC